MSTPPMPPRPPHTSLSLSRVATIIAVVFGVAFGLCSVSATVGMGASEKIAPFFVRASLIIEAACVIGLLVVGMIALIRSVRN
jgi:hypothetical protein